MLDIVSYKGLEYETGKALLAFLEEMKGFIRDLQPIGSSAVRVCKAIGEPIESKARELEIPPEEAVDYFFSRGIPGIAAYARAKKGIQIE